ncbi:MAG: class I SAM-dependent methyltransferase, partial [Thermodesulfobacteriota bacterium]
QGKQNKPKWRNHIMPTRQTFALMRPKEQYDKVVKQRERDGMSFFEKYNFQFVEVLCPVCGVLGNYIFEKYGFKHKKCEICKTLFCSPRPTENLLGTYYNSFDAPRMWTEILLQTDVNRKSLQYQPRVDKIISLIQKSGHNSCGTALDLGAGSGAFAMCLENTSFFGSVLALDLSDDCIKVCKNNGLNALRGSIADMDSNSVDLICINDLIEHVFDPSSFLRECYRVLRLGGYVSIATPNGEGFDFKIMKERTMNITPPEHLNYFNPDSLVQFLSKKGFHLVSVETPGMLDVEIVQQAKISGFPLEERNEYLTYLLEQGDEILGNFQRFISENKLSSHMLILAKKNQEGYL